MEQKRSLFCPEGGEVHLLWAWGRESIDICRLFFIFWLLAHIIYLLGPFPFIGYPETVFKISEAKTVELTVVHFIMTSI